MFVMNYPAFLNVTEEVGEDLLKANNKDPDSDANPKNELEKKIICLPGQGYRYGTATVLTKTKLVYENNPTYSEKFSAYTEFLTRTRGNITNDSDAFKSALTEMAFFIVTKLWNEVNTTYRGNLYFCIGGVNSINPFHVNAIKNEVFLYAKEVIDNGFHNTTKLNLIDEGAIFNINSAFTDLNIAKYTRVYLDFSGSMAFFNDSWEEKLQSVQSKLHACFIMGGVLTDQAPKTLPSLISVLNRFSCSTMNQLYHPVNTAQFLNFINKTGVHTYVVSNNAVDAVGKNSSNEYTTFLQSNCANRPFLMALASTYYGTGSPQKMFDYYTALALSHHAQKKSFTRLPKRLFYEDTYGIAFIGKQPSFKEAVDEYDSCIIREIDINDSEFDVRKKLNFYLELNRMSKIKEANASFLNVFDTVFRLDPITKKLTLL